MLKLLVFVIRAECLCLDICRFRLLDVESTSPICHIRPTVRVGIITDALRSGGKKKILIRLWSCVLAKTTWSSLVNPFLVESFYLCIHYIYLYFNVFILNLKI